MARPVTIVGAGLAGLIAAHIFPRASIIERQPRPAAQHRALLRFRSDEVSKAVDVPFRKVRVHKGLWFNGRMYSRADIRHMNMYARKISPSGNGLTARSIADLSPVDRWVAPDDLYAQLVDALAGRIAWGVSLQAVHPSRLDGAVVSTMPLPDAVAHFNSIASPESVIAPATTVLFQRSPIMVRRWRFGPETNLHQTVYYPADDHDTYRVSITGNTLIAESMTGGKGPIREAEMLASFGLTGVELEPDGASEWAQSYGKIYPVDDRVRRELIHKLTINHNVYSLGRFATWRNLLLDDVVKDARIIRNLIDQADAYSLRLNA